MRYSSASGLRTPTAWKIETISSLASPSASAPARLARPRAAPRELRENAFRRPAVFPSSTRRGPGSALSAILFLSSLSSIFGLLLDERRSPIGAARRGPREDPTAVSGFTRRAASGVSPRAKRISARPTAAPAWLGFARERLPVERFGLLGIVAPAALPPARRDRRSRRHDLAKELADGFLRKSAAELRDELSVSKRDDGRDSPHSERLSVRGDLSTSILARTNCPWLWFASRSRIGPSIAARTAPRRPEVDDDRHLVGPVDDFRLKLLVGDRP